MAIVVKSDNDQIYQKFVSEAGIIGNASQEGAKLSWDASSKMPAVDYKIEFLGYDLRLQGMFRKVKSFAGYAGSGLETSLAALEWSVSLVKFVSEQPSVQGKVQTDIKIFELAQKALFNQVKIYNKQYSESKNPEFKVASNNYMTAAATLGQAIYPEQGIFKLQSLRNADPYIKDDEAMQILLLQELENILPRLPKAVSFQDAKDLDEKKDDEKTVENVTFHEVAEESPVSNPAPNIEDPEKYFK